MMDGPLVLLAIIFFPLLGSVGGIGLHRWGLVRDGWTLLCAIAMHGCAWWLISMPEIPPWVLLELFEDVPLTLHPDPLGRIYALLASGLWIANAVYAFGYMRANHEPRQTAFYAWFGVAMAATMGLAFSGDLLTLLFFYEALTLSTYPLVTHSRNVASIRGGRVYLRYLLGSSLVFLVLAIIWTWAVSGTLIFTRGGVIPANVPMWTYLVLSILYAYGVGKAALFPLHGWLPAAMVAPTPVSALLHAVAVVKAGVFTLIKVFVYVLGFENLKLLSLDNLWLGLAGFTIIFASIKALQQDHLKKRLAYSTISNLSYIILSAALFTPLGIIGATLHLVTHAFGKITLFFVAGAIHTTAHIDHISQMQGIGRRMPWTMGFFFIGVLSMIGLPPTAGFLSKWFILRAGMDVHSWWLILVLGFSTVMNVAYFAPILVTAFLDPLPADSHAREAPILMLAAMLFTALMTLLLFFRPDLMLLAVKPWEALL